MAGRRCATEHLIRTCSKSAAMSAERQTSPSRVVSSRSSSNRVATGLGTAGAGREPSISRTVWRIHKVLLSLRRTESSS